MLIDPADILPIGAQKINSAFQRMLPDPELIVYAPGIGDPLPEAWLKTNINFHGLLDDPGHIPLWAMPGEATPIINANFLKLGVE